MDAPSIPRELNYPAKRLLALENNVRSSTRHLLAGLRELPLRIRLRNNARSSLNPAIGRVLQHDPKTQGSFEEVVFAIDEENGAGIELSRSCFETVDGFEGGVLGDSGGGDGGEEHVEGGPGVGGGRELSKDAGAEVLDAATLFDCHLR
jgi:hypothetical protein